MTGHQLITPRHRSIRKYYESVAALQAQGVLNEMSVRSPFESLLQETARLKDWTFIAELSGKSGGAVIRPDGTLRDRSTLPRGYWEAEDTQDDLDTEIKKKIARGYPLSNIIFEDTQTGALFQNKQKINGPYTLGNPEESQVCYSRVKTHLKDKHSRQWNRFSVYLTIGDEHLRELETLILRVVKPLPEGNSKSGKFARSENLLARLAKNIRQRNREKLDHIVGKIDDTIYMELPGRMPPLLPYVKKVFKIRGRSKGKTFHASVRNDGTIRLQKKANASPSAAASAATKYPIDGWSFWKYERAPGDWVRLDQLRK